MNKVIDQPPAAKSVPYVPLEPDMAQMLNLDPLPRTPSLWNEWEIVVSQHRLMAVMLEPRIDKDKSARLRVQTQLALDTYVKLRRLKLKNPATFDDALERLLNHEERFKSDNEEVLLTTGSTSSYRHKMYMPKPPPPPKTGKQRRGSNAPVRRLLTTGFLVHLMWRIEQHGKFKGRSIKAAAENLIMDEFKGSLMIYANEKDLSDCWSKYRGVGHLAAAFYALTIGADKRISPKAFTSADLTIWRERMPDFLSFAHIYEGFISEWRTNQPKEHWAPNDFWQLPTFETLPDAKHIPRPPNEIEAQYFRG